MATLQLPDTGALDPANLDRERQSRQNESKPDNVTDLPDGRTAVARITGALINLFGKVLPHLANRDDFPVDILTSFDRSRSSLLLWSDGYWIADGNFDGVFERSQNLTQITMKILRRISATLIDRLIPLAAILDPDPDRLCAEVTTIIEEVDRGDRCVGEADESSSDTASEYETDDTFEIAEDLKTDVECLVELDPILRSPVLDPKSAPVEAGIQVPSWTPHQVFVDKMRNRFPKAEIALLSRLDRVNYERYLRCQSERDRQEEEGVAGHEGNAERSTEAGSKFHDSDLSSSKYAQTLRSYRDGKRSVPIPPLSADAKNGQPFACIACGRLVTITNNSEWKRAPSL